MSTRARRLAGALSLLALLTLVAAAVATADEGPTPTTATQKTGKISKVGQTTPTPSAPTKQAAVHAEAYRLAATLAGTGTTASGHWIGFLVHTNGVVQSGVVRTAPGCTITGPPKRPIKPGAPSTGVPSRSVKPRIACRPLPAFPIPSSGNHWILIWRLTYTGLSAAPTGTDIRLSAPGTAGALVATICTTCATGKTGRAEITGDQAKALLDGKGYVVVRTAAKPDGEISGQITRVATPPLKKQ